jgi:CubicO group peptidase (beta-lactamase class C family)
MESPLLFAPGKSQAYSSSNYVIAGLLAEEIYGSDIESLIEENLLSPLGLGSMKVLKPSAGAPGTGTGNMVGSLKDLSRWAEAMWRSKQVLGEYGNRLVAGVDPVSLIGPLGFAYCPCKSISGSTLPAAYGMNGVYVTLRYYKALDTIVVIYLSKPLPDTIDSLVAALLDPATFPQGS